MINGIDFAKFQPFEPNKIIEEVERRICKNCSTCDLGDYCDEADENKVCNRWRPDFMEFQDVWTEVERDMKKRGERGR